MDQFFPDPVTNMEICLLWTVKPESRHYETLKVSHTFYSYIHFSDVKNAFQVTTTEKSFVVFAETPEEKKQWIENFAILLQPNQRMNTNLLIYNFSDCS